MPIVDAHIHYADSHPALLATLDDLDLKLLNVCVAQDAHGAWREQAERYGRHTRAHPRTHHHRHAVASCPFARRPV